MRIACCDVVVLILLLFSLNGAFAEDVSPVTQTPETIHVTLLPVQDGFGVRAPFRTKKEIVFKKEPSYTGKKVIRGFVSTNRELTEGIGCAWDESAGKLYVDFNGNQDLTDDPDSVYLGTKSANGHAHVNGVRLQRKINGVNIPCIVDFWFYPGKGTILTFKSGWLGEFDINGQRWRLGIGDDFGKKIQFDTEEFSKAIFLTRADAGPFTLSNNLGDSPSLIHVPAFFAGVMGAFSFSAVEQPMPGSDEKRVIIEATIKIERPETFSVRLTGKSVESLVLESYGAKPTLAVFQQPNGEICLPTGEYTTKSMVVGKGPAFVSNSDSTISVVEGQSAILNLGGPLKTTVIAERIGSMLQFDVPLVGVGGEKYIALSGYYKQPKEPQVAVYKGDEGILLAQLEYG